MMEDWDDEDMVMELGSFLNPLPLSRRGIRRNRRHLGNSDLHEIMSIIAYAADELYQSPDEDDEDDSEGSPRCSHKDSGIVKSLLDMCAKAVAKTCTCEVLELHHPPLDEALLRKVAFWAFPQDEKQVKAFANLTDKFNGWERGCGLVRDKRVKEMWQVGFMATAYLSKYIKPGVTASSSLLNQHHQQQPQQEGGDSSDIRVSLTFEQQKIVSSTCSECKNDVWCSHIIAAIIFRIKNPTQVRVHAPMTETLSTLDRDQLQKLLQYAVNEDPAGILGKVFKHVDAVRDSSSEMSVVAGAPDPTFGRTSDTLSQWQLSLQWLCDTLKQELNEMTHQRIYEYTTNTAYYPDSYDWSEKIDSRMYSYMGKVLDLARQCEVDSAAEVLITVSHTVLQRMDNVSHVESPCLSRFAHDLIHIFTILILNPHSDRKARSKLVMAAKKFNAKRVLVGHKINNSEWAELPSIQNCFTTQLHPLYSTGLFVEPLAAELVPPWPTELHQLMDGIVSDYDEDVVLMLVRLETLFHLENNDAFPKIGRLCSKIIHKLTALASKLSILGSYIPKDMELAAVLQYGSNALETQDAPTPDTEAAAGPAATRKGKGKGRITRKRRAASKGKQISPKRRKLTHSMLSSTEADLPLPKGQLVYALLYSLHMVQVAQKVSRQEFLCPRLVSGACLLALELSHFRTVAPAGTIKLSEHNWLLKLENMMCEYLRSHPRQALGTLNVYLDAYTAAPASFFAATHPLTHVELVLELCRSEALRGAMTGESGQRGGGGGDQQQQAGMLGRRDDVLQLCAAVLSHAHAMLDRFTLPTSSPFDIFIDTVADGSGERRKHRDFAVRKLRTIAETLFSLVDVDNNKHVRLLSKVLHQFERVENGSLLKMLSKDVRMQLAKFERVPDLLEAALRFAIHAFKKTENLYLLRYSAESRTLDREFIFSMARKIGVPALKLFVGNWQTTFSCDDVRDLLLMMEGPIKACSTLPRDVASLITQYYEASEYHGERACDLLAFCSHKMYTVCKSRILDQPQHFHVNALFQLAQKEQEQHPKPHTKARASSGGGGAMSKESFAIVQKALANLRVQKKDINSKTYECIDWVYEACIAGAKDAREINNRVMFTQLLEAISSNSHATPEVLLRLLQNMGSTANLVKLAAAPLATALVTAYQNYFDRRYFECTHAAYASIINEMHRARLHCKQYLKTGDTQFDEEVVDFVKRIHSGKKKLVKMLNLEFGPKLV